MTDSHFSCLFLDDRRRGARIRPTEDNRRHTLGNDMLVYAQQNQNMQQRAMDLEVNIDIIYKYYQVTNLASSQNVTTLRLASKVFYKIQFTCE